MMTIADNKSPAEQLQEVSLWQVACSFQPLPQRWVAINNDLQAFAHIFSIQISESTPDFLGVEQEANLQAIVFLTGYPSKTSGIVTWDRHCNLWSKGPLLGANCPYPRCGLALL